MAEALGKIILKPADRLFPLKEGDDLYRYPLSMSKPEKEPQFSFDVAFGQGEVVEGEPLVETLNDLIGATEQTVELCAPLF